MKLNLKINIVILVFLTSCSGGQFTLEQYQKYPVKFAKQIVTFPESKFEIFIPSNFEWKIENYDDIELFSLGINAVSKPDNKNFFDSISVQKYKGFLSTKKIEDEYFSLLESQEQNSSLKIIESGETNIFKTKTYFIHSKSNSGQYGAIELFTFITEDNNSDEFYLISASASRTDKLKMNMSIMIQCIRTFKQAEQTENE